MNRAPQNSLGKFRVNSSAYTNAAICGGAMRGESSTALLFDATSDTYVKRDARWPYIDNADAVARRDICDWNGRISHHQPLRGVN